MTTSPKPPIRLEMPCSNWLTLSLMVFGVVDCQMSKGRRVLSVMDMLTLHKVGGRLHDFMINQPTYAWHHSHVLLYAEEAAVLLKVIRWYEDTLLAHRETIETLGENELIARYEKLTQITRALQTAPAINSDHGDL